MCVPWVQIYSNIFGSIPSVIHFMLAFFRMDINYACFYMCFHLSILSSSSYALLTLSLSFCGPVSLFIFVFRCFSYCFAQKCRFFFGSWWWCYCTLNCHSPMSVITFFCWAVAVVLDVQVLNSSNMAELASCYYYYGYFCVSAQRYDNRKWKNTNQRCYRCHTKWGDWMWWCLFPCDEKMKFDNSRI